MMNRNDICPWCGTTDSEHESECPGKYIDALRAENARLREALEYIQQWAEAYSLEVFPEPDMNRARTLLEAGYMTLDAVSAHNMRWVLDRLKGHVAKVLEEQP